MALPVSTNWLIHFPDKWSITTETFGKNHLIQTNIGCCLGASGKIPVWHGSCGSSSFLSSAMKLEGSKAHGLEGRRCSDSKGCFSPRPSPREAELIPRCLQSLDIVPLFINLRDFKVQCLDQKLASKSTSCFSTCWPISAQFDRGAEASSPNTFCDTRWLCTEQNP